MTSPLIGIIAYKRSGNPVFAEMHGFFRDFARMAQQYNAQVVLFSVDDVDLEKKVIRGLCYSDKRRKWVEQTTPFPAIVYDRVRFHPTAQFRRYTRLRKSGVMNFSYFGYSGKHGVFRYLSSFPELKPYLPETEPIEGLEQVIQFVRNGPAILKPVNGTAGRGVFLIEAAGSRFRLSGRAGNIRLAKRILSAPEVGKLLRTLQHRERYLIQRYVPIQYEGHSCDTRVLIQKDGEGKWTLTGMGTRIGAGNRIVSNLAAGANAVRTDRFIERYLKLPPGPIMEGIEEFGLTVGKILDRRFGNFVELGLDVGIAPDGNFKLFEANSKPARKIFKKTGQWDLYEEAVRKPLEYHLYLIREKPFFPAGQKKPTTTGGR